LYLEHRKIAWGGFIHSSFLLGFSRKIAIVITLMVKEEEEARTPTLSKDENSVYKQIDKEEELLTLGA